jgi:serine/threonine protein phosphatase PrpC
MTNDRDKTQPLVDPGAGREETLRTNDGMVATAFGMTDVGMQRSINQDTLGNRVGQHSAQAPVLGLLYAIADGMGGHARGEVASALAIHHLFARYYGTDPDEDPRRGLERVLLETNAAVHQAGRDAGGASMGTTLTLALLRDGALYVGNIGDSRTYLIRQGKIEQLTHDHSLIGEQVRSGLLTEAQARQSSIRNVITRAVGYREEVEPDVFTYPVMVGDIVLLCSDGLHSMADSQELAQHLSTQPLGVAVPALIELAKQRGGPDNITALAVRIDALAPVARSREDATTVPMTPTLNDAVTKPFTRTEGEAAGGNELKAAAVTVPLAQPPPPPRAVTPPPPMSPMPPTITTPASRSSARLPMGLLIVLPLLLLAVVGGGLVILNQRGNGAPAATISTGVASTTTNTPASNPSVLPVASAPASVPPSPSAAPAPTATTAAAATPTTVAAGATSTIPRSSTGGPTVASAAPNPPAPTTTIASSISNSPGTIIGGTFSFSGGPPPTSGEWEIVVFLASELPSGLTFDPPPTPEQLLGLTPTWSATVAVTGSPTVSYDVRGDWKGNAEERAIVVLRRTVNGQSTIIYPQQNQGQVTLRQNLPNTAYPLVFVRPVQ